MKVVQVILFLDALAFNLVSSLIPFVILDMFVSSALRPETVEEAPLMTIKLQVLCILVEYTLHHSVFPIVIELSNKYGRKKLMLVLTSSSFAANLILLSEPSLTLLLLSSTFRGLSHSIQYLCLLSLSDSAIDSFESTSPREWFKLIGLPNHLSFFLGPALSGLVCYFFSIHLAFTLATIVAFVNVLFSSFLFSESSPGLIKIVTGISSKIPTLPTKSTKDVATWEDSKRLLYRQPVLCFLIFIVCCFVPASSGLWVMYCKLLFKWNDPWFMSSVISLYGFSFLLGESLCLMFLLYLDTQLHASLVASLLIQGLLSVAFSQIRDDAVAAIVCISLLGLFSSVTHSILKHLFYRNERREISKITESFLLNLSAVGLCLGLVLFGLWFWVGFQHKALEIVFLGQGSFFIIAVGLKFVLILFPSTQSVSTDSAESPDQLQRVIMVGGVIIPSNEANKRSISPLSTVEEGEEILSQRRNSISAYSESSIDWSGGRTFGDTIVEWDFHENHDFYHSDEDKSPTLPGIRNSNKSPSTNLIRRDSSSHSGNLVRRDSSNMSNRRDNNSSRSGNLVRRGSSSASIRNEPQSIGKTPISKDHASFRLIRRFSSGKTEVVPDSGSTDTISSSTPLKRWGSESTQDISSDVSFEFESDSQGVRRIGLRKWQSGDEQSPSGTPLKYNPLVARPPSGRIGSFSRSPLRPTTRPLNVLEEQEEEEQLTSSPSFDETDRLSKENKIQEKLDRLED